MSNQMSQVSQMRRTDAARLIDDVYCLMKPRSLLS